MISVDTPRGCLPPHSTTKLSLSLTAQRVGHLHLPVYFNIIGSDAPPLLVTCQGNAIGPRLVLEKQNLDWGAGE